MGFRSLNRAVHGRADRYLGLHALHDDPAARRIAVAAAAAVRGGSARRSAGKLRILPDHASDAGAVHHYGLAVPPARLDPAIRHHLRYDSGWPLRPADGVSGPGLSRILPIYQCWPLDGAVDDPLARHQYPVEYLHQELAAAARTRAPSGVTVRESGDGTCQSCRSHLPGHGAHSHPRLLHVSDLLDPVDVVPDQRADPADSAPHLFRADAPQLRGAVLGPVTYRGGRSPD